jgi:hypothetical protein
VAVTKNLNLKITADARDAEKGFKKASAASDRFGRSVSKMPGGKHFSSIGKGALGAAAGFGAIAIAGNEISKSISTTMGLAKATRTLQRATGLAAEDASQLAAVLQQRGIDATKSGRAFTTLARQTRAAADGSESASKMFKELGVSQAAIKSGDVTAILTQASDGFNRLGDGQAKAAIAQQLFGKGAKDIIPLLEGGSKALREQLGLAPQMSQAQVTASLKMVGAQREINTAMMAVRVTLGTALMPLLSKGATDVAKFVTQMRTGKGAGGEFAAKLKAIYESAKPALKTLLDVAKAVFNFAANNPGVVKLVASLAAVGLAVKVIKFGSAISGLSSFMSASKALSGPIKTIFKRIGIRAGATFAAESAASMAADFSPAVMKRSRSFSKVGGRLGSLMGGAMALTLIPIIIAELNALKADVISKNQDLRPGTKKYNEAKKFGSGKGNYDKKGRPTGKGASAGASSVARRAAAMPASNPFSGFLADPLTGGPGLEPQLAMAETYVAKVEKELEKAINAAGSTVSKAEQARITGIRNTLTAANKAVTSLQSQIGRRDAFLEIKDQFKGYVDEAVGNYRDGLSAVAQASFEQAGKNALASLTATSKDIQRRLSAALAALDEESGTSPEAQRLRELRAEQERLSRSEQDDKYSVDRLALETQLNRYIRSGNTRRQNEINAQILQLDADRAEVTRTREITALSDSLNRQRTAANDAATAETDAAQTSYDNQTALDQAAYDKQIIDNAALTTDFQTNLTAQLDAQLANLTARQKSYADFAAAVNSILTGVGLQPGFGSPGQAAPIQVPAAPMTNIPIGTRVKAWVSQNIKAGTKKKPKHFNASQIAAALNISFAEAWGAGDPKSPQGKSLINAGYQMDKKVSGGMLTPGMLTMVGETGPELIVGGKVHSATRTNRMGAAGGMNITVNAVGAAADDPMLLARQLGWQLATR